MPPKILVINGHGAKTGQKVTIDKKNTMITPGKAEVSYILSFDKINRHLEEITIEGKVWPIQNKGKPLQWHHYRDRPIDDMNISPLQKEFSFRRFAGELLSNKTTWDILTKPSHNVMQRGALAVKISDETMMLYEREALQTYLEDYLKGDSIGTPVFFCDKELGKVKPVACTTLSDIYEGIKLISEFKAKGTQTVIATCSPTDKKGVFPTLIKVITEDNPVAIKDALIEAPPEKNWVAFFKEHLAEDIETSSLSLEQIERIVKLVRQLNKEINSIIPYRNKDRKEAGVNVLTKLMEHTQSMSVIEAIVKIIDEFGLSKEKIGTRTAKLLAELAEETPDPSLYKSNK